MRPLIGIAGRAGAGKTTIAKYLEHRHHFHRLAFADTLKYLATRMGWDGEKDERGRRLLQHLGDVGREYREDCWIRPVMTAARGVSGPADGGTEPARGVAGAVIEDCRYINECREILSRPHGIILFVDRPDNPHALDGDAAAHSSEALHYLDLARVLAELNHIDNGGGRRGIVRLIHNTGSQVDLWRAVDAALSLGEFATGKAVQA